MIQLTSVNNISWKFVEALMQILTDRFTMENYFTAHPFSARATPTGCLTVSRLHCVNVKLRPCRHTKYRNIPE